MIGKGGQILSQDISFALEVTAEEISDILPATVVDITFNFDLRASNSLFGQYQKSDNYILKWMGN